MQKPSLRLPALLLFACYALYGAVLVPLYQTVGTDVVLQNSFLFDLIDAALQWIEIIGLTLCFAFLIDGVYRFSAAACRALFVLTGGALLFKYVASAASLIIWHRMALSLGELGSSALSWLIELSLCAVVTVFAALRIPRAAALQKARQKAARQLGQTEETPAPLTPFGRPFDRRNILQTTALFAMILLAVIRMLLWVVDDLAAATVGLAFTVADIPVTLLYWLLLILLPAAGGYFLMLLILQKRAQ